jgi:hypothetical protein
VGKSDRDYDLFRHRHNFAVWAAARAAQRGFTSVAKLKDALECCGIREFVRTQARTPIIATRYDAYHRTWCRRIVRRLRATGVARVSHGRAAKLIAVYLKTMVVTALGGKTALARVAHPPIDRILLQNICRANEIDSAHRTEWRAINWSQLDAKEYYRLIRQLRACLRSGQPFWMLEEYWTVTNGRE